MPSFALHHDTDRPKLARMLAALKLPVTVSWAQGFDRSQAQNRLQWMWAAEAANQFGDRDAAQMQAEWKLRHGVPILRADDDGFREWYDRTQKGQTYEQKIDAMKRIAITSDMRVGQMGRYLDSINQECAEMGVTLTQPEWL